MTILKGAAALCLALSVAACTDVTDKTRDQNIFDGKSGDLSQLTAGIWVDPQGCEHWIIDDGVEGYADLRRTPDGKPVCNSELPRNVATGPFKSGSTYGDPL
ncbi:MULTISPECIES: hypothetical protein [Rhodobacterales]|jgi:hypothetical protein|uniref:Lipoprotein n=1 Tax=Phaeobacter gallaeciensis TaxID=60890 RepID=A0A1B0ZTM1_9RHOB|nr:MULTISPECIES: hypothetical protein [Phaeobacter]MDF1773534.1 hypothetical protein [Pseudophaeobacter sp. bin_em_oilr2.035]MEE2633191.1 hypothetical protein [Pseudomonadota bacterium]ANP37511.1 hypothetical protein JL2886_02622 [Phaeobacter gallaeciensis]MDE4059719.1 hypothetical protein [Phaeobacter gallaeciensis]MDE4098311.1 hypothetical protein [Phaeobacter gallaeciensis]